MQGCKKPTLVCLRFENDRGLGWEISRERAIQILKESYRKGLMQCAELGLQPDGSIHGGICNCCSDCCFPQQVANALDVKELWPLMRYKAEYNETSCSNCGRCAQRCPYGAFTFSRSESASGERKTGNKTVQYDPEKCRGCGLCAGTCATSSIAMRELETPASQLSLVSKMLEET